MKIDVLNFRLNLAYTNGKAMPNPIRKHAQPNRRLPCSLLFHSLFPQTFLIPIRINWTKNLIRKKSLLNNFRFKLESSTVHPRNVRIIEGLLFTVAKSNQHITWKQNFGSFSNKDFSQIYRNHGQKILQKI